MATKASAYTTIYRILAFLLVSQSLYSQYSDMLAVDPRLRLGVSYLTHVDAHFSGPALSFSPAYEAGQYDNGYVKESAYNSTSKTWNWGFDSNSQLRDELISYSTTSFSGSGISLSPQEGSAGLRFDWVPQTKTFGRRIAFNSLLSMDARKFSIEDRRELPANFETITKYHSHAGIDPTLLTLPYAGTYEGPGPLLALAASNSKSYTQDNEASLHRYMGLDGFLFTLGAGGEVHLAVTRRLSFFYRLNSWLTSTSESSSTENTSRSTNLTVSKMYPTVSAKCSLDFQVVLVFSGVLEIIPAFFSQLAR